MVLVSTALTAAAYKLNYGNFDRSAGTCAVIGWEGVQPMPEQPVYVPATVTVDGFQYKVTDILEGALDGFDEAKKITLGSNVKKIGKCDGLMITSCGNFNNCPNLRQFIVDEQNPIFKNDDLGILLTRNMNTIVRVPSCVNEGVSTALRISNDVRCICPDAFAGVTSLTALGFPPSMYAPLSNMGIDRMPMLQQIFFNTGTPSELAIVDNVLYTKDMTTLIAYPPHRAGKDFTVPETVSRIYALGIANASQLNSINVDHVTTFGKGALSGSNITSFSLPYQDVNLGEGMLMGCQNLTNIIIPRKSVIPKNFARNSANLNSVLILDNGNKLGDNAFRDCRSLTSFNFNVDNELSGDSIFAGCGFKQIVFSPGESPASGFRMGDAIFYGCPELELIDFSGILTRTEAQAMEAGLSFAANCPKLVTVRFPRVTAFWSSLETYNPALGVDPHVKTVEIGAFSITNEHGAAMFYTDAFTVTPTLYCKTTDAPRQHWSIDRFFHAPASAPFHPVIFCDNYDMSDPSSGFSNQYVFPGASYYVPARASENYDDAKQAGCIVAEMFYLELGKQDGKLTVKLSPRYADNITFNGVLVNGNYAAYDEEKGIFVSGVDEIDATDLKLEYKVRNVSMTTKYDMSQLTSGVDGLRIDDTLGIRLHGRLLDFGKSAEYTIFTLSGATVLSGNGESVSLDNLETGIYIVKATSDSGETDSVKIVI